MLTVGNGALLQEADLGWYCPRVAEVSALQPSA